MSRLGCEDENVDDRIKYSRGPKMKEEAILVGLGD